LETFCKLKHHYQQIQYQEVIHFHKEGRVNEKDLVSIKDNDSINKAFRKEYLQLLQSNIDSEISKKHKKKHKHKKSKQKKWKNKDDLQSLTENIINFAQDYKKNESEMVNKRLSNLFYKL
jgi:uncharacterized protein YcbK (DUF882 family)